MPPTDDAALLRTLAERLLATRALLFGAELPTVQIVLGAVPPDLPLALPIPPAARVLGAASLPASPRPGGPITGAGVDIVLDVPGSAAGLFAFYDQAMSAIGWSAAPRPMVAHGGFAPLPRPSSQTFCHSPAGPWLSVTVYERPDAPLDVRLHLNTATPGPCAMPAGPPGLPAAMGHIPTLTPPASVMMEGLGGGGSEALWHSNAIAHTDRPIAELAAHFGDQLRAADWTREEERVDGGVAWSRWQLPGADGWRGLLLVVAEPDPGRRWLHVRAEHGDGTLAARSGWSIGAGGWMGTTPRSQQ